MNKDEGNIILALRFLSGTPPADINTAGSDFVTFWDKVGVDLEKKFNCVITRAEADVANKKLTLPIKTHAVT